MAKSPAVRKAAGRGKAYAKAGVDVDLGNRIKATLPGLLASARRPEVLGEVGGFGGLFALDLKRHREPVLVSSVDGVGTKLKVAFLTGRHDTIGEDLVHHCVNDIAVLGAEPLFFLDYLSTGRLEEGVFRDILTGFARGCANNGCALVGGETAQMPGFYADGEYDVAGTIVGVVERRRILDGRGIREGDVIIGLAGNGLHTNGYSLARRILFERMKLDVGSAVPELGGRTVGDELLRVHPTYYPDVRELLEVFNPEGRARSILGMAHITGGGLVDNLPRVLPSSVDAVLQVGSWDRPPIFDLLRKGGRLKDDEMYQAFNMGVGMAVVVRRRVADRVLSTLEARGRQAWCIGTIAAGTGRVVLKT